jgi:hypothetical protein
MPFLVFLAHEGNDMLDFRAPSHVSRYYPKAIKLSFLQQLFLWFVKYTQGITEDRIALLTSVCSDDLNTIEWPRSKMVGPLIQGGLDG